MTIPEKTPSPLSAQLDALRLDRSAPPPRRKKSGGWRLIALLALAGAGGWAILRARPPVVETGLVVKQAGAGGATARLSASGYIVVRNSVVVSAEVSGRVIALNFDRGDAVTKGQWLARLDDRDYRVAVQRAEAQRQQAEADLALARAQLARARDLVAKKIGSQEALDTAQRAVQSGEASVALVRADAAAAALNLERTTVRAPFAGTVLERLIEIGETARPGFGGADLKVGVAKLADLSQMEVEVDISERDVGKVREGQQCLLTADGAPGKTYRGTVRLRAPEANRAKAVVQARVKIDSPDADLRPEMTAQVTFYDGAPDAAAPQLVLVPQAAILDGAVFILKDGIAVRTLFTAGEKQNNYSVAKGGLSGGEEVILNPEKLKLRDGQKVRVKPAGGE